MRFLLVLSLIAYLMVFTVTFGGGVYEVGGAYADETNGEVQFICPFDSYEFDTSEASSEDAAEGEAEESGEASGDEGSSDSGEESSGDSGEEDEYENWALTFENAIAESGGNCGEPNSFTGYLEKGDCTKEGKVVTEITEIIAPNTDIDEDHEIITVYAGLCCLAYSTEDDGFHCKDVRTIYTQTYDECAGSNGDGAASCEKRQWVIGKTGIGILKLMVKQIYAFGAITVGSIAVATIIFQSIKISASGVSGDITESKNKILQAITGIVLLFLSGLILYTINPEFFGS